MKKSITVAIADDDIYWRSIASNFIQRHKNAQQVFTSNTGYELLLNVKKRKPELLILDSHLPLVCGIELAILLKTHIPELKIICLCLIYQNSVEKQLIQHHVDAYTTKDCDAVGLSNAFEEVLKGKKYYCNHISIDDELERIEERGNSPDKFKLKPIEVITLVHLSNGLTSKQICDIIGETKRTTENRIYKLREKFNVQNTPNLVWTASSLGIIPPPANNEPFKF